MALGDGLMNWAGDVFGGFTDSGSGTSGSGTTSSSTQTNQATSTTSGEYLIQREDYGGTYSSGSSTSDALDVTLDARLESSPGRIEINGDVSGMLGASSREVLSNVDHNIIIRFRPFSGSFSYKKANRLYTTAARAQLDEIRSRFQSLPDRFGISGGSLLPGDIKQIGEERRMLSSGVFGNHVAGKSPVRYRKVVNFEPIPVPSLSGSRISEKISDLPDIPITVEVIPTETVQRVLTDPSIEEFADRPSVTLNIPPEAFFREVDLENATCGELFPDTETKVNRIQQRINTLSRNTIDDHNAVRSIAQDVLNMVGVEPESTYAPEPESTRERDTNVSGGFITDGGRIDLSGIEPEDIRSLSQSRIDSFLSRLQKIPSSYPANRGLQTDFSQVRREVNNIGFGDCASQFLSVLDGLGSKIDRTQDRISKISNLRDRLIDLLGGLGNIPCVDKFPSVANQVGEIEYRVGTLTSRYESITDSGVDLQSLQSDIDEVEQTIRDNVGRTSECYDELMSRIRTTRARLPDSILGCSDVPRRIRNRVSGFEGEAQEFTSRPPRFATESRFNNLLQEATAVESIVNNEVSNDNPCKQELLSRIDEKRGSMKGHFTGKGRESSCDEKFPKLHGDIQDFKEDVARLNPKENPVQAAQLIQQGRTLAERADENVPDDTCVKRFTNSIKSAIETVTVREGGLRVRLIERISGEERSAEFEELKEEADALIDEISKKRGTVPEIPIGNPGQGGGTGNAD